MSFKIIGKRFSREEFTAYVAALTLTSAFMPGFVVVHNTAVPTLAQRPKGFTEKHMDGLRDYYANKQGWSGGPSLFIDDNGIWVFNPLDDAGVHSPSWNTKAWGVELLGDYSTESPTSGRGAIVVGHATHAVATLLDKINVAASNDTIKFHYEDPLTTHACPGKLLTKAAFVQGVKAQMDAATGWTVVDSAGKVVRAGIREGALGTGLVRASVEAIGGTVAVDAKTRRIKVQAGV